MRWIWTQTFKNKTKQQQQQQTFIYTIDTIHITFP